MSRCSQWPDAGAGRIQARQRPGDDDGLQLLAASKSLKKLALSGLKGITPMGIAKLRKAQPKWVIEVN
jgi:hypothetical protein